MSETKPLPCPFCDCRDVEEFHEEVDIGVGIQRGPSSHRCPRCEASWGDYSDWPTRALQAYASQPPQTDASPGRFPGWSTRQLRGYIEELEKTHKLQLAALPTPPTGGTEL